MVSWCTTTRRDYPLQTDASNQPGQLGRTAGEPPGRGAWHQHGDPSGPSRLRNLGIGFAVPINIVRELLPQLRNGQDHARHDWRARSRARRSARRRPRRWARRHRKGAVVSTVAPNGPAAKAGLEPGDVVTEFNGRPVNNDRTLVEMVVATKPGTTVPVKVIRDGAREVAQRHGGGARPRRRDAATTRPRRGETDVAQGFGIVLEDITPAIARRLRLPQGVTGALVSEVRPRSVAARQGITEGDVIVRLGRTEVTSADDAMRELQQRAGRSGGRRPAVSRRPGDVLHAAQGMRRAARPPTCDTVIETEIKLRFESGDAARASDRRARRGALHRAAAAGRCAARRRGGHVVRPAVRAARAARWRQRARHVQGAGDSRPDEIARGDRDLDRRRREAAAGLSRAGLHAALPLSEVSARSGGSAA